MHKKVRVPSLAQHALWNLRSPKVYEQALRRVANNLKWEPNDSKRHRLVRMQSFKPDSSVPRHPSDGALMAELRGKFKATIEQKKEWRNEARGLGPKQRVPHLFTTISLEQYKPGPAVKARILGYDISDPEVAANFGTREKPGEKRMSFASVDYSTRQMLQVTFHCAPGYPAGVGVKAEVILTYFHQRGHQMKVENATDYYGTRHGERTACKLFEVMGVECPADQKSARPTYPMTKNEICMYGVAQFLYNMDVKFPVSDTQIIDRYVEHNPNFKEKDNILSLIRLGLNNHAGHAGHYIDHMAHMASLK